MVEAADSDLIIFKRKPVNALLPYAIYLEQSGQQAMIDAIFRVAKASNSKPSNTGKFMWHQVVLYISRLFEKRSPTSLNRVIILISPYVPWDGALNDTVAVARWVTAASAIPYTEEVGSSVVDALFQIAWVDLLRPHIPIEIWRWLKRQPPLPSMYHGLLTGAHECVGAYLHKLGDVDIIKSYFLLVWTHRFIPDSDGIHPMERSIREYFGGAGMEQDRKDLIEHLDQVIWRLDQELQSSPEDASSQASKKYYTKLMGVLLEVGG